MTDEPDYRLTGPVNIRPDDEGVGPDEFHLKEIFRGRMFCLAHGRECYRRAGAIDGDEWVCPDERHRKPIRIS